LSVCAILCVFSVGAGVGTLYAGEKTIDYGILTALSGPAAPWGIGNSRGMELGADEVNEKGGFTVKGTTYKWKVHVYDHKYIPAEAVKALNKAIFSDKTAFVSIQGGSPSLACMSLLKQNNILSLSNAAGGKSVTNPNNPLFFRFNPAIESSYASILPYIQTQTGFKTVACINPDDETGKGNLEAAKYVLGKLHMEIVASEFFERGIKDFTSVLTRIIAKKPDLIETGMADPTSQALILKQARELGYKGVMFLAWGPNPEHVVKICGPLAEGAYLGAALPEPVNDTQKAIKERFLKKYPERDWDSNYYTHYALFPCLTKAIVKCQSFDPMTIAKTLEGMTWKDAFGEARFGGEKIFGIKRQMLQYMNLLKVKDGSVIFEKATPTPPGILDD